MKIISNLKDNKKQFSHVRTGDIFKYKNNFYIKVAEYYKQGYTVTKLMGPVALFYGACLATGTIKEFKSDEIVTVYRNSEVIIKE